MVDQGEAKQVANAASEAEKLFQNMADVSPLMICCSGPDRKASFFNKSWLSFTGRTLDRELGLGWTDGLHPEDRDRTLAAMDSSFEARNHCYLEYRLRRADGEYRSMLCGGFPCWGLDGAFAGYIATCTDNTIAKREQEQAIASQRLKSLGLLTKGIAHNFNNLLGGILVSTEVALASHADALSVEEELQKIRAATIRGAEIVRELRIYGGGESTTSEPVAVASLIEEIFPLLQITVSKQVTLKFHTAKDLPVVEANPGNLRLVIMNLVMNASEAIGQSDGVIQLKVERVHGEESPQTMGAEELPPGDYIQLEVTDTGSGMTSEVQSKIFDPFFSTKLPGRGMGLAVVEKILREHGSPMRVKSSPGAGTTIQIWFPTEGKKIPAAPAVQVTETRTGTVLVVEDEDLLRLAVTKALRKKGFVVLEACDGPAALDLIRSGGNAIDVVLLDLMLRGMSSREFFEEARRSHPDLKAILTSAYGEDTALAAFSGIPIERFLRKPFHLAELVKSLQDSLV
jgi:two-component system, cell cycle sensor histidine kinase and response regulator CckA